MNNDNILKVKKFQTEPTEQEFKTMGLDFTYEFFVRGYRTYLDVWKIQIGEQNFRKGFDNYKPTCEHAQRIFDYLTSAPDKSYIFLGNNGTGKTHLAYALANHYVATYWERMGYLEGYELVKRITARDLSLEFRSGQRYGRYDGEDIYSLQDYYQTVDFLIIDEIGRTKNSEFFQELIYSILDYRYEHKKQTVLISNLSDDAIKEEFGTALYDRTSNWCVTCQFDWTSFRPLQQI